MIRNCPVDTGNVFDVCGLATNADGMGTVMEQCLCRNAVSIAESKSRPEMHPYALCSG